MKLKAKISNSKGQTMVIFVFAMIALLGAVALVIDVGNLAITGIQLQNMADSAALAGAQDLPNASLSITSANTFAAMNNKIEGTIAVTTPYNSSTHQIRVTCSKEVPFFFASVIGMNSRLIERHAVAEKRVIPGGYAIFSGGSDELILNGGGIDVLGAIHTNDTFKANGINITVSEVVEATDDIIIDHPIGIPNTDDNADHIPLSDYVESINLEPGLALDEKASAKTMSGDYEVNSNPSQAIYAKGKIEVKTDHLHITHSLIADGDIYIDAEHLTLDCPVIYSRNGKIEFKKGNVEMNGIVYAPDSEVIINNSGGGVIINGRIVGDFVRLNGPGITVDSSEAYGSGNFHTTLLE